VATTDDILGAMFADPDDDAAKLVYADAIGGARGEAIVLATDLARAGLPTIRDLALSSLTGTELAHRAAQHRRLETIGTRDAVQWASEFKCYLWLGRHGMLERLSLNSAHDLGAVAKVASQLPLDEIDSSADQSGWLSALAALPLSSLTTLITTGAVGSANVDAFERLLAGTPRLTSLTMTLNEPVSEASVARIIDALSRLPRLAKLIVQNVTDPFVERLGASALAPRLRELELRATRNRPWPGVFVDPLVALDGRFSSLESFGLWLDRDVDAAHARPARLVVPAALRLLGGIGRNVFDALLPALSGVRALSLYQPSEWRLPFEQLVPAAPRTERLELSIEAQFLPPLAALPLRHCRLFTNRNAPTAAVAALLEGGTLESIELSGYPPGLEDLLPLLAASPRMRGVRALSVTSLNVGDEAAFAIARSPHFARLRSLVMSVLGGLSDRGLTALAESPTLQGLVELSVRGRTGARLVPAMAAHPLLARVGHSPPVNPSARAALEARFGALDASPNVIHVFLPRALHGGDVARALPHDPTRTFSGDKPHYWLASGAIQVVEELDFDGKHAIAAGALGAPFTAASMITISARTADLPHATMGPIVRSIAAALAPVAIWDAYHGVLLDLTDPTVAP
jgi:hypothetical protein